ncbi:MULTISPECIES: toprim domain-containing protein [Bacteroidales]|uniref:toprim domain-containing protein n=1 Tax=Bacteroidales TaxID=171549 RepID=UPI0013D3FCCE|nr:MULTISPECIES: toprim domain-containing protein [Bacteroidales]MDH6313098.1 hypothetical protein [Parabacteroides sp. PFB2-10]NDV82870.1 mobilization protein [Bacteroides sp. 51]
MDSKTINMFPIREYLADLNIYPAKERGYYGMYHSPFRKDKDASMKVDYNKNLWIDYGANEGGTLIDLVMRIKNCSNGEAMRLLEQKFTGNNSLSFHGNNNSPIPEKEREPTIQITNVSELNAPALINYLNKRGIDTDIAKQYCKEINYTVNDKPYYGIGFQNQSGGYEIRNPYFKGCIAPKDISYIQQTDKRDTCYLFEGFIDYLSFLTIRKNQNPQFPCSDWQDYIILNSIANLPKAARLLSNYEQIHCFLDNDTAGITAYKELEKEFTLHIRDASRHYSEYKDLNDYLCGKKHPEIAGQNKITKLAPQPPKKKNRGFKM